MFPGIMATMMIFETFYFKYFNFIMYVIKIEI